MAKTPEVPSRSLTQQDFERIERLGYKLSDDIAVSIARSLERLEERVDAAESRLFSRLADISDEIAEAGAHINSRTEKP